MTPPERPPPPDQPGDIRQFFFKNRGYTPIPLALLIIYFARPTLPHLGIGLVLLIMGEGLRIRAVSYAGATTRSTRVVAPFLCTAGPFARVRNPLYLGNLLMYTGVVLIAGAPHIWAMLALTLSFFLVQYSLIISLEEETLTELFGQQYLTYRENVPSVIPRRRAWSGGENRTPLNLRDTLRTEKRTLQNVGLILLLITVRVTLF